MIRCHALDMTVDRALDSERPLSAPPKRPAHDVAQRGADLHPAAGAVRRELRAVPAGLRGARDLAVRDLQGERAAAAEEPQGGAGMPDLRQEAEEDARGRGAAGTGAGSTRRGPAPPHLPTAPQPAVEVPRF